MFPLPAHTVDLVLQYISPLSGPLPPHLISVPLRQRHHFLQLSPSSPVDYLCWPSQDNATTIHLLSHSSDSATSRDSDYPTRYTSDSESTFAHVQISPDPQGLRMLFLWDDGWKYHDLQLMPYPSPSFPTPQESLTAVSTSTARPPRPPSLNLLAEADDNNNGSDDSYWDAYGATERDLAFLSTLSSASMSSTIVGEDAYWARYASVQGSADSTVPSPLPVNRKLRHANFAGDEPISRLPHQNNPIIGVPIDTIHSRPLHSISSLSSPHLLADLLSRVSPQKDICPLFDDPDPLQSPLAYSSDHSPEYTATDSELVTPPLTNGCLDATIISPVEVKVNELPLSIGHSPHLEEAEDKALTDSIKGLYCLWKAGRKGEPGGSDRNIFLRVVQAAVPYE